MLNSGGEAYWSKKARSLDERKKKNGEVFEEATRKDGSWWPEWAGWLKDRSGPPTTLLAMGAPQSGYSPLADAPGAYVIED